MEPVRDEPADQPSKLQRSFAVILFGLLMLACAAMFFSRHLPSPLATRLALAIALGVAAITLKECLGRGVFGAKDRRFGPRVASSGLLRHAWMRVPLMTLFAFAITFSAVEDGMFAVVTALIGQPGSRAVTISGEGGGGRRSCRHFEIEEAGWVIDRALCIPEALRDRATAGDRLTLYGKQSPLGLIVDDMELQQAP